MLTNISSIRVALSISDLLRDRFTEILTLVRYPLVVQGTQTEPEPVSRWAWCCGTQGDICIYGAQTLAKRIVIHSL
jgi:hypothetical protein